MIGRIMLCDNCHGTGNARPAVDGRTARLSSQSGTIRRVEVLRYNYTSKYPYPSARVETAVERLDLCGTCRSLNLKSITLRRADRAKQIYGDDCTILTSLA